jgi:hypothetical protein
MCQFPEVACGIAVYRLIKRALFKGSKPLPLIVGYVLFLVFGSLTLFLPLLSSFMLFEKTEQPGPSGTYKEGWI